MNRPAAILAVLALTAGSALAQGNRAPAPTPPAAAPQGQPAPVPGQSRLDRLFQRLEAARTDTEAKGIADQIERLWLRSGSDTSDLLMTRVVQASRSGAQDEALDILDSVLALQPNWAEAWYRRASVHFARKDFDAAMRDLGRTLALEPRHFEAMAGVGIILNEVGQPKKSLVALRRALKLHPHLKAAKDLEKRLAADHDGRDT
jgi:tetratricopeptide (TPR) repeat protein